MLVDTIERMNERTNERTNEQMHSIARVLLFRAPRGFGHLDNDASAAA